MRVAFRRSTAHWDEISDDNSLTQMLGTGRPTQREYLGCLRGRVSGDTTWILASEPARGMKQLQFAVTGSCTHLRDLVGTWHTHPFRADPRGGGGPLKERVLSADDLRTFAAGCDRVVLAVWDVDSMDVAARGRGEAVRHPAGVVVR